jgi:hypothetical protein
MRPDLLHLFVEGLRINMPELHPAASTAVSRWLASMHGAVDHNDPQEFNRLYSALTDKVEAELIFELHCRCSSVPRLEKPLQFLHWYATDDAVYSGHDDDLPEYIDKVLSKFEKAIRCIVKYGQADDVIKRLLSWRFALAHLEISDNIRPKVVH